jgi:hypothetical protein
MLFFILNLMSSNIAVALRRTFNSIGWAPFRAFQTQASDSRCSAPHESLNIF